MAGAILRVGIDVGGTFTDVAAVDSASGRRMTLKVSSTPRAPELGEIFRFPPAAKAEIGLCRKESPRLGGAGA